MTQVQSITNLAQAQKIISTMAKPEVRCCKCNKLLAKYNQYGLLAGEIKCGRCGYIQSF